MGVELWRRVLGAGCMEGAIDESGPHGVGAGLILAGVECDAPARGVAAAIDREARVDGVGG
ncbi:hypothetical protein [Nannocystis punicea]|uniref:Uncharacterized protein n=1 Tax=Nannocystis punicea TaxID=2995304 RepID=A0ABY7GY50_9BACT|nr:hypothetical protein [Nannocystis poenicansa]WAS91804.1 hypothetical protein O0S08_36945 [Nannocystis poenicansa]